VEVKLGDAQVAGGFGGPVAALGDKEAMVDIVEGEALLDCRVSKGLAAEEVVRWR
jgi:hypothetical protein